MGGQQSGSVAHPDMPSHTEPASTIALFGVNKFLASGLSANSDWGRAPARLNPVIEAHVLDQRRIIELLELFKSQPWLHSGSGEGRRWQADAQSAAMFAMQHPAKTAFECQVEGKTVTNYLAVGPGKTLLVCWEGTWTDRGGGVHRDTMYQVVVPYWNGLSKSAVLRDFLDRFTSGGRVMLSDWDAANSVQFRQACKAILHIFPDLTEPPSALFTLDNEVTCTICLEDLEKGSQCRILSVDDDLGQEPRFGRRAACGHVFHKECIMEWLASKELCPVCRQSPWSMT